MSHSETAIVTTSMNHSVTDGSLFLIVNRRHDRIKALWWETGGLTLWYRRLEQGTVGAPKIEPRVSSRRAPPSSGPKTHPPHPPPRAGHVNR